MSSPHSKRASPESHQRPYAPLWGRNWIFLPPDSNEEPSPSAINKKHIIGKRLRSSASPQQTLSKIKKETANEINDKPKQGLEGGLDQLNQTTSLSTTKDSYDTADADTECEQEVSIFRK